MSTSTAAVLLSFLFVAPLAAQQDPPTIIRDVAVIDVLEGSVAEHRSVVIHDGRIAAIGPAGEVAAQAGAEVVDGSGKYLIPGLCDMHTHLLWSTDATEHTFAAYLPVSFHRQKSPASSTTSPRSFVPCAAPWRTTLTMSSRLLPDRRAWTWPRRAVPTSSSSTWAAPSLPMKSLAAKG